MATQDDILEGGRAIRPYLPALLGPEADIVDQNLSTLLALAERGEAVSASIAMLLRQRKPTQEWMRAFLEGKSPPDVEKLYQPPPGHGAPVAPLRYVCPNGHFEWFVSMVGEHLPSCPIDNIALVPG